MKKSIALIPAMMMAATALPAMAQAVPTASRMDGPPLLSLSVTENVEAAPDVATVSTGVESRAPSASEAMSANARDIDRLVAAIKGADPDITLQAVCTRLEAMRERTPRGRTSWQPSSVKMLLERDFPFITFGRTELATPHPYIDVDNFDFTYRAAQALIAELAAAMTSEEEASS